MIQLRPLDPDEHAAALGVISALVLGAVERALESPDLTADRLRGISDATTVHIANAINNLLDAHVVVEDPDLHVGQYL